MNNARRKRIEDLVGKLREIEEEIEEIHGEEEDCHDNLPEAIRFGEKGDSLQQAMDSLDNARGMIGDLVDELEAAKQ